MQGESERVGGNWLALAEIEHNWDTYPGSVDLVAGVFRSDCAFGVRNIDRQIRRSRIQKGRSGKLQIGCQIHVAVASGSNRPNQLIFSHIDA